MKAPNQSAAMLPVETARTRDMTVHLPDGSRGTRRARRGAAAGASLMTASDTRSGPAASRGGSMTAQDVLAKRAKLLRAGYAPLPLHGKIPPLKRWQKIESISYEQIEMWGRTWPDAINTGVLTRTTPTLDADILDEAAARRDRGAGARALRGDAATFWCASAAAEARFFVSYRTSRFQRSSSTLSPATAASRRSSNFSATVSRSSLPEFIPTPTSPIAGSAASPGPIAREDLPYIREAEARELVERAASLLVADFGYVRAGERPRTVKSAPATTRTANRGPPIGNICAIASAPARALHDSLARPGRQADRFRHGGGRRRQFPARRRWKARARRAMTAGANASTKFRDWSTARRSASPRPEPEPQPEPVVGTIEIAETLEGVRQVAGAAGQDADLCRARRRRRQPAARRSGLARPDRAAVIRQDRNSQRHGAASEGGAGRDLDGGRAAVGHAQEAAPQGRARRPAAAARRLRHHRAEGLRLDPLDAHRDPGRGAGRPA